MANLWHVCYKWRGQSLCVARGRSERGQAAKQIGQEAERRAADWVGNIVQVTESRATDWTGKGDG